MPLSPRRYLPCLFAGGLMASATATEYADRVREDRPVAWWRFDGDAKDASGNGHHGELVNAVNFATGLPGTDGKGAQFDGDGALVQIARRDGLRQETLSVELWFRSTQPFDEVFWPGSATLISTATSGPGSRDWLINAASQQRKDEGRLLAEIGPEGAPRDLYMPSRQGDPLNDGHWHHVVLTRHENGEAKLFVDSLLHFEGNDGRGRVANDRAINIGGEAVHPGGRFLIGDIDEVAIYDKVLPPKRIAAHFAAVAKHLPPRPVRRAAEIAAPDPPPAPVPVEPVTPLAPEIAARAASHWAFQPIRMPPTPAVRNAAWIRNPIDHFILARMESEGSEPAAEATPDRLVRRAHFDLLGLPPAPELVRDAAPADWPRLVDQLLASPHYGERYARHWLDVVRYADSAGYELDNFYHHASRYRDYVIRSLNSDKPFDRFVHEQLAADILAPDDEDLRFATGFFTVGPYAEEGGIERPRRVEYQRLTDASDTTAEAFLGLSYGCARCHDHKFEPISQRDYFALQAIMASGELVKLPVAETKGKDAEAQRKGSRMHVIANRSQAPLTRLFERGDYESLAGSVPPGVPSLFSGGGEFAEGPAQDFRQRRLRLARWITSPENPLAARVIANRVWMWHFGWPLVATPNDFGIRGERPSHPELLDYLASYLREHGWSLKALHRHIMTSATYRMASSPGFPRRRLEAEAIWDNLLATAGVLNTQMYGPPVFPPIDRVLLEAKLNAQWTTPKQRSDWARRGIYVVRNRSLSYPFFETFNVITPIASCGRRDRTVDSPQALTLLNDPVATQLARAFAGRLWRECGGGRDAMIEHAWLLAFGRSATAPERAATQAYLDGAQASFANSSDAKNMPGPEGADPARGAALVTWCLALFNANEFIYVD